MDITEVDAQKMDSLKQLAETNLKVSESRVNLSKLQEEEETFIVDREKRTVERVNKVLADSKEIIEEANNNYTAVQELTSVAKDFASYLSEAFNSFRGVRDAHKENQDVWEKHVTDTEEKLSETRKILQIDRKILEIDKETLKKTRQELKKEKQKIDEEWEEVKREKVRLTNI